MVTYVIKDLENFKITYEFKVFRLERYEPLVQGKVQAIVVFSPSFAFLWVGCLFIWVQNGVLGQDYPVQWLRAQTLIDDSSGLQPS